MRVLPLCLLLALLAPAAAADGPTLALRSGEPVALAGALDVTMPDASLYVREENAAGVYEVVGVTGVATVWRNP